MYKQKIERRGIMADVERRGDIREKERE